MASCFASIVSTKELLIDRGFKSHKTHDKDLSKEVKLTEVTKFRIGHGCYIQRKGLGTITIETQSSAKVISNVLYVPDLDHNLLRIVQLLEKGFKLYFLDKDCLIMEA